MHTIEIPDLQKILFLPEELDEFTNDQFIFLVEKLLEMYNEKIAEEDIYSELVFKFLGVRQKSLFDQLSATARMQISENVTKLSELLHYIFIKEEDTIRVNYTSTRNFVPVLKSFFRRNLYGPADALTDITFLEYKDANIYYQQYIESKDEADLNRMIAVLYRPKNIFRKKLKYNPVAIERNAKRVAKFDLKYRFATHLFIVACEEFLHSEEIMIDGQAVNLKILYEQTLKEKQKVKKPKYESNTGLAGIAFSLASTGIFGPIEKVYDQNLYSVLLLLYKQRIEYLNDLEKS